MVGVMFLFARLSLIGREIPNSLHARKMSLRSIEVSTKIFNPSSRLGVSLMLGFSYLRERFGHNFHS